MSGVGLLVASGCCDKRTGKSVVSGQSLLKTGSDLRKRKGEIVGRLHVCASAGVSEPRTSWKAPERNMASQAPPEKGPTTTRNFGIFKSAGCRG